MRTLSAMSQPATPTILRFGSEELVAGFGSQVIKPIHVIHRIAKEVAALRQRGNQLTSHGLLTDVHRSQGPGDGHRAGTPDRVELVALLMATRSASITC